MPEPNLIMANGFSITLQLDGSIDGVDGIFMGCDGFDFTQEVIQFREVTNQRWGNATKGRSRLTKFPGNAVSGNITLRRGMNTSTSFWLWFSSVQEGNWFKQRKNISITFYAEAKPKADFQLTEAWPTSYRLGDMTTNSSDVQIEELEIAYEGFERIQ
jgi:phage tail-like protein